jgi:hypothetical protein
MSADKLLDGAEYAQTHDFVLVSADSFMARDVAQFDWLGQRDVRRQRRVPQISAQEAERRPSSTPPSSATRTRSQSSTSASFRICSVRTR